jgi:hypothetical protein
MTPPKMVLLALASRGIITTRIAGTPQGGLIWLMVRQHTPGSRGPQGGLRVIRERATLQMANVCPAGYNGRGAAGQLRQLM